MKPELTIEKREKNNDTKYNIYFGFLYMFDETSLIIMLHLIILKRRKEEVG